jgi:hypothetical protein
MFKRVLGFVCSILGLIISIQIDNKFWIVFNAFFSGANLNSKSEEIMYNMITTEGIPRMYMYKCTNYPLCEIDINNRTQLISVNEINRMSTWHNTENEKNNSPIDPVQYVMVAICDDIFDSKTDICQFQTSIYGNEDSVYLLEGESFSQYIFASFSENHYLCRCEGVQLKLGMSLIEVPPQLFLYPPFSIIFSREGLCARNT